MALAPPPAAASVQAPPALPAARAGALAAGSPTGGDAAVTLTTRPQQEPGEDDRPLYKRWWVWAVAGGLAAGAVTVFVIARGSGDVTRQCPQTSSGICATLPAGN